MKIYIKPSGAEVPVNENSEQAVLALGWKPKEEPKDAVEEFLDDVADLPDAAPSEEVPRQKRKYTRRSV